MYYCRALILADKKDTLFVSKLLQDAVQVAAEQRLEVCLVGKQVELLVRLVCLQKVCLASVAGMADGKRGYNS